MYQELGFNPDYYEVEIDTPNVVRKSYAAGGSRVAMREDTTLYWLFPDHLGSTSITANSSGTKVAEMRYKPLGETRYTSGTTPTDFHNTGKREEADLGFYYRARWGACPERRPQDA